MICDQKRGYRPHDVSKLFDRGKTDIPVQRHMPTAFSLLFLIIRRIYTKRQKFLILSKTDIHITDVTTKRKDRDKELVSSKDKTLRINGQKL